MLLRQSLIVAISLILLASQVKGARRVTVDAGMGYMDNYLMLLAGDEELIIEGSKELQLSDRSDLKIPKKMKVRAGLSSDLNLYLYGPRSGFHLDMRTRKTNRLIYGPYRKFLKGGGPDAAAWKGDKAFFFKGCEMVRRYKRTKWGKPKNVTEIGLPCNPDAAWNIEHGREMIILKGDEIWRWDEDDNVEGPNSFSSMYNITSWELIPSNEA